MPVVKGGVWTNIEDEILKASVSKYGLNQWARVSSLLARKTPKQCKARWAEWLDPGIRKVEWSKDEDEKLLHLAKLMPTQWRTIAPIVGRTATQCLERYQRLLDEADAREGDDLGLAGPDGGETMAPSADDVRRLRPGELDPDPESKPARPDTIDMDEDEKEMLSEARARLANTQGKKAKRKARERQLEESRRLANLQKRRELKSAGINVRITSKKKGQMDYNADVPFEHAPAAGFYDTLEEKAENEEERESFDPRRQQVQNKRKVDQQDGQGEDRKRRKNDQGNDQFAAAKKAGQMQKIREAEQSSKRRGLVLPAPQVSESELEDIVKMGMSGDRANVESELDGGATQGLVGRYNDLVAGTPIRTPRAPQEEDRIANEVRNARLRTSTQSALLGGENAEIDEAGTTGYSGAAPTRQALATPNPMATPMRAQLGPGATPVRGPGATPMRTPRDNLRLNAEGNNMQLVGQTPADIRRHEKAMRNDVKSQLASLPKPKRTEWDLDLLEEQDETTTVESERARQEDAAVRDRREKERRDALAREDLLMQSRVVQRGLPRPAVIDLDALLKRAEEQSDPTKRAIEREMALLMAHDARKFGNAKVVSASGLGDRDSSLVSHTFDRQAIDKARMEVALELGGQGRARVDAAQFTEAWEAVHMRGALPGLDGYGEDEVDMHQLLTETFDNVQTALTKTATKANTLEAKLSKYHGGYQSRAQLLHAKIGQAGTALSALEISTQTALVARVCEFGAMRDRLDRLRGEVGLVTRLDREAQEVYRSRKGELEEGV